MTDPLDIYVDPRTFACYRALGPTEALVEKLGLTCRWLPTNAPQEKTATAPSADESVGTRHRRIRQNYRWADHQRYARWHGLECHRPTAELDIDAVSAALLIADDQAPTFLRTVCESYWSGNGTAIDRSWCNDRLEQLGVTNPDWAAAATQLAEVRAHAQEIGVINAPMFAFKGELFWGHEHLPMIERIASEGVPY